MDISTISWKFVFPDTRDDLLVSETGRMSVSKVVPVHNISTNLESARESVKKRSRWGWWSIQHFDTFFSVILWVYNREDYLLLIILQNLHIQKVYNFLWKCRLAQRVKQDSSWSYGGRWAYFGVWNYCFVFRTWDQIDSQNFEALTYLGAELRLCGPSSQQLHDLVSSIAS